MNYKEICHPMIYEEYLHIAEDKDIYPVYLPEAFRKLYKKIDEIKDYENNYKSFTKLSFLGAFLQEKFPNIVDFDLSVESLEGNKPWLYVLGKPNNMRTIGYMICEALDEIVDGKDYYEEFKSEISTAKQSFRGLENGITPLNIDEVIERDRLIEGLYAYELCSKGDIPLCFDYKEETEESLALKKKRKEENIPFRKSEKTYNEFKIDKKLNFIVSYESSQFKCISKAFSCYVKDKIINFSYVVTFNVESTKSGIKYLTVKISKRTWVNDGKINRSKNNRKHSLYLKSCDNNFVNIKIRVVRSEKKNNNGEKEKVTEYKFNSKCDKQYFENLVAQSNSQCSIEDIVSNPINYQVEDGLFMAFPHDNVSLGEPSKKNGVSIIEKRAIIKSVESSMELNPLTNLHLENMKHYSIPKLKEGIINTSGIKVLNLYVFEKNDNFFVDVVNLLSGSLIDFISINNVIKDKATGIIKTANGDVVLNLIQKDGRLFANPQKDDIADHVLDILDSINDITISKKSTETDYCLVELPDYSKTTDEDSKDLIRASFYKEELRTQFVTPLITKKTEEDSDIPKEKEASPKHRVKSAIQDILSKVGLIYNNNIDNTIAVYSYVSHKFWNEYTDSEGKKRKILIEVPLLAKFKENKVKVFILAEGKKEYDLNEVSNRVLKYATKNKFTGIKTDMNSCYNTMAQIISDSKEERKLIFIPSKYKEKFDEEKFYLNEISDLSITYYTSDTPAYYTENIKTGETTKSKGYFTVNLNGYSKVYLIPQKSATDKINKYTNNYNSNTITFFQRKLTGIESYGIISSDVAGELFQCYRLLSISYDGMLDRDIVSNMIYNLKEYIDLIPMTISQI